MTRPDPTVTVPVEPTEAMLDAWHKATWPQGPRVSPLSQQGLSFARAYRAMLSAAPAAPQAAGVGDCMRPEVRAFAQLMEDKLRANDWKGGWKSDFSGDLLRRAHEELGELDDEMASGNPDMFDNSAIANEAADVANMLMMVVDVCGALPALRPPSREPEGGAVWFGAKDYEPTDAMIDAGEYHNHRHNPLTNLVASFKAMMEQAEIDGLVSCAPALATREEAPACEMCNGRGEVGGPTGQTPESFDYVTERCPDCGGTGKVEAPADHHERNLSMTNDELIGQALSHLPLEAPAEAGERIVGTIAHVSNGRSELPELIASAIRAQPQAREDAQ